LEFLFIDTNNEFIKTMEQSKKDIKEGKISNFDFNNFEKKLNENV